MRIFVIGDSHTQAIKEALKDRKLVMAGGIECEAYRYTKLKNGIEIGDLNEKEIIDRVAALDSRDMVVSTIGGNQHQILSLVQHPLPFDFRVPDESSLVDLSIFQVVPYNQLWDVFELGIKRKDGIRLRKLREVAKCPVIHLIPPPPKADAAHILKRHESDFVKAGLAEKGVSPAPMRLRMWKLQAAVLQRLASEWQIQLLFPPAEALDREGFLASAYYANDATHANAKYGALVLDQLARIATGETRSGIETGV